MPTKKSETGLDRIKTTRRTVLKGIGYTVATTAVYSIVSLSSFGCSDESSPFEPQTGGGYGYY